MNERTEESEHLAGPGDDSQCSSSEDPALPLPPDGGFGWVVCASAFFCMVLLDGILFSFGVFFLELLEYFNESKAMTAMVGSVLMGMSLMGGPIVSVMINLWGLRPVAMAGALVASGSIGFSLFAPNITILTITYGFFGGFGISMVYLPAILAVGFYFEKRRAFANGISMSGSGIGTFIYSPLCNYLQTEYSWKGAVLILSGITLHCVAFGALFRPLRNSKRHRTHSHSAASSSGCSSGGSSSKYVDVLESFAKEEHNLLLTKALTAERALKSHSFSNLHHSKNTTTTAGKVPGSPDGPRNHTAMMIKLPHIAICDSISASTGYLPDRTITHSQSAENGGIVHKSVEIEPVRPEAGSHPKHSPWMSTLYRKDLFYSGSFSRLPEYNEERPAASLYSLTAIKQGELASPEKRKSRCSEIKDSIHEMAGLSLIKDPVFLFSMASMVLWTTHSTVLNFLPDYAVHHEVGAEQAAFLLSIIGITNTLARVLAGWLSDHPRVSVLWVNMSACLLGGLTCLLIPFTHQYPMLAAEAGVFGFCMGTWTSLRPIILVEMLGLDNLTNAFGLVAMFQGLAFSVGPPIAGFLFDYTQSYVYLFHIAGGALVTSGLICIIMNILSRRRTRYLSAQDLK